MRKPILLLAAFVLAAGSLAGCSSEMGGNVITPVTKSAGELQDSTVELEVGQVLNITTGDLAPDSYSGEITEPSVAEFIPGGSDGSSETNPGVKGLEEGQTQVVLSNSDGGIEDVTFTVTVTG